MSDFSRQLLLLMVLVFMGSTVTSNVWAQVDYSGTWGLDATTYLPDEMQPCEYSGTAIISQNGADLSGTASLTLTSGPGACPSEMTAAVSGVVRSGNIELGLLLGGQLGEATFYSQGAAPAVVQSGAGVGKTVENGGMSLGGSFNVTVGPYAGQVGSWSAMMAAMMVDEQPIPTLAFYGLLMLVLVLVVAGGFSLRRRHLPG